VASFWLALALIFVFAVQLSLVPTSGYGSPTQLILPVLALSLPAAGQITQVIHASLLSEYRQPYVITARSKGLRERVVMYQHVLRNTAIVTLTLLGSMLAGLLNGTVLIESIFAWPGLGQVGLQAVQQRDLPVLMTVVFYFGVVVTVINLVVDIAYGYLDPRVRLA
jgi:peptide/nickel transport system permease protein